MFWIIVSKIVPLYFLIGIGYVLARQSLVDSKSLSYAVIYGISPCVLLYLGWKTPIEIHSLLQSICIFVVGFVAVLGVYLLARIWFPSKASAMLACIASTGNNGFIGLPILMSIMPSSMAWFGVVYVVDVINMYINGLFFLSYDATGGYVAGIKRLFSIPSVWGGAIGIIMSMFHIPVPADVHMIGGWMVGSFIVIGMMIVGSLLYKASLHTMIDWKFVGAALCARHLVWLVLLCMLVVFQYYTHFFSDDIWWIYIVFAVTPIAGVSSSLAQIFDANADMVAIATAISTVLSLVWIPGVIYMVSLVAM